MNIIKLLKFYIIKYYLISKFEKFLVEKSSILGCVISYNKYGGYCIPLSSLHRSAAQKILNGEIYEPETIEFLTKNSKNGDIVHAGTYFGDFLPALSRSINNNRKIFAFEPNPENYRCAKITIDINNIKNVELINQGLGSKRTKLKMKVFDDLNRPLGGGSKILKNNEGDNKRVINVEIVALDEVLPSSSNIKIIQLDVEGFEIPALLGAMNTIKRCHPILILENLPENSWLEKHIFNIGYYISGNVHGNSILYHNNFLID